MRPANEFWRRLPLTLYAALAAGCVGGIGEDRPDAPRVPAPAGAPKGEPADTPPVPPRPTTGACAAPSPPTPAPLRRLTRVEYDNTVADLLGDTTRLAAGFVPEERVLGFDNNADVLGVTPLLAEQLESAADRLAWNAVANLPKLMECDPADAGEACVRSFVTSFGKRAFRRPLTAAEINRYVTFAAQQRTTHDQPTAVRLVVKAMLMSPHFLYRVEAGARPTPHELASRLSYLLWSTMPDQALFAAAETGKLSSAADVATQARRLLADPRARAPLARFFALWLDLERLDHIEKDAKTYPTWRPALGPLLRKQAEAFIEDMIFTRKGALKDLFTATHTLADKTLADTYDLRGPTGSALVPVTLDAKRAAGLLSLPGLLAAHAKPNQTSPIERGRFVREALLCQHLAPPPADLMVVAPDPDPRLTTRARFAAHAQDPRCAGCHQLVDPIGFGFENYDGIGRWRDMENGTPVDASGKLVNTSDIDGPFVGVAELGRRLAESADTSSCFALQWLRYAQGRAETDADGCSRQRLQEAARGDLVEFLVTLTQTDAFLGGAR